MQTTQTNALPSNTPWTAEHAIAIATTPEAVFQIWRDVGSWHEWNAGVERAALRGSFDAGTTFTMAIPGGPVLESRLVEVVAPIRFVDETRIDEVVVRVTHRIDREDARHVRVTYAVEVSGPDAAAIGAGISADFPDVLKALKARASQS